MKKTVDRKKRKTLKTVGTRAREERGNVINVFCCLTAHKKHIIATNRIELEFELMLHKFGSVI